MINADEKKIIKCFKKDLEDLKKEELSSRASSIVQTHLGYEGYSLLRQNFSTVFAKENTQYLYNEMMSDFENRIAREDVASIDDVKKNVKEVYQAAINKYKKENNYNSDSDSD